VWGVGARSRRCAASRCWELRYGCLVHRRVVLTRPAPKRGGVPQLGRLLALAWGAGCLGWDACGLRLGRWLPRVGRLWAPTGALVVSSETPVAPNRSEEHTSELQSREKLVCRLLLEKKNNKQQNRRTS